MTRITVIVILLIIYSHAVLSQQDTIIPIRFKTVTISTSSLYAAAGTGLYFAWYSGYTSTSFHFFDDIEEWNQSDKLGHTFSAYFQSKVLSDLFRWSGMNKTKSVILGTSIGFMAQNSIEFFDGLSSQWGASVSDIGANFIGSALYLGQELAWKRQLIKLKYSFTFNSYRDPILESRSKDLFGANFVQRTIKDYNGTTLWFAVNSHELVPRSSIPNWLGIAVGIGNGGMFGGFVNQWTDSKGVYYDYNSTVRYRKFLIAPDIDISSIKTKNKLINSLFYLSQFTKLPTPTLEINTKGEVIFHPFYQLNFSKQF